MLRRVRTAPVLRWSAWIRTDLYFRSPLSLLRYIVRRDDESSSAGEVIIPLVTSSVRYLALVAAQKVAPARSGPLHIPDIEIENLAW